MLEEIIESKDSFLAGIREADTNTGSPRDSKSFHPLVQRTNQYFKAVNDLKENCGENIGYSHRQTLAQAEKILLEAAALIREKSFPLRKVEKRLDKLTRAWLKELSSSGKEEHLKEIVLESFYYRNLTDLEAIIQPGRNIINSFYADFSSSLSFLADEELANKYLKQYAKLETAEHLQGLKQKYEEELQQKRERERMKLGKKYNHSFFALSAKPEYALIDAEPIAPFRELYADLKKVLANPEKYLCGKRNIEQEKEKISSEREKWKSGRITLDDFNQKYLACLSSLFSRPGFDDLGSLYLRENIRQYQDLLETGREELGKFIARTAAEIAAEIDAGISGSADKLGFLSEEERKVSKLKGISKGLNLKVKDSLYSPVEDKIRRMKDYYSQYQPSLCPPSLPPKPAEPPKVKQPLRENYSTKGEIEVRGEQAISENKESPAKEELLINGPVVYDFPSLKSEGELFEFAYRQRKKVNDSGLARYCALICGVDDDGWDLHRGREERLKDAAGSDFSRLEGRDGKVYEILKLGLDFT